MSRLNDMRDIAQANQFKCTVCSILPFELREPKPGLNPGEFVIPASDGKIPTCVIIKEGTYGIYLDGDRGTLRARTPSTEVSRSIFEDYISAQLAVDENSKPGLFALPGVVKPQDFETDDELKEILESVREQQNRWFERLVKLGDDIWQRYHQHGAITDLMRYAAKSLGHTELDWMKVNKVNKPENVNNCPACMAVLNPQAALCGACGCIVNQDAYANLSFAGKPSGLKTSLAKVASVATVLVLMFASLARAQDSPDQTATQKTADIASYGTVFTNLGLDIADALKSSNPNKLCSLEQKAISYGIAIGVSEILKATIHKARPDLSDMKSFPSEHTALAFASQGWSVAGGITLGVGTGAGRKIANRHDMIDISVGAGIGEGSYLLSKQIKKCGV